MALLAFVDKATVMPLRLAQIMSPNRHTKDLTLVPLVDTIEFDFAGLRFCLRQYKQEFILTSLLENFYWPD